MDCADRRILIVEDDVECREVLSELLGMQGYGVSEAKDGADAVRQLVGGLRPAVILLDLVMPRLDGRGFLAWRQRDPEMERIPVLLLTGQVVSAEEVRALRCQGLLPKPLDLTQLLTAVARAM